MLKLTNETPRIATGRRKSSWLFSKRGAELNSGLPKTNPASGREGGGGGDLTTGPLDYKFSGLQVTLISRFVMVTEKSTGEEKWWMSHASHGTMRIDVTC